MRKTRFAVLVLLALLMCPIGVEAGNVKVWRLEEIAHAPVLVVGRVLDVRKNERVPEGALPWQEETWAMTAQVEVLRFYTRCGVPLPDGTLPVHFLAYGPNVIFSVNGYPPPLPYIKPGEVLILPLQENASPALDLWRLIDDSGAGITTHARPENPDAISKAASGREFLIREIANLISRGAAEETEEGAGILSNEEGDWNSELLPLMEPAIGSDLRRWAHVAADLIGFARGTIIADFISGGGTFRTPNLFLARAALQKLGEPSEIPSLLIQSWIENAAIHPEASASSLVEFRDNPYTTETLRNALDRDVAGTSYIALEVVRKGSDAILPEALARALRVADRPESLDRDIEGATSLVVSYGSDPQFDAFLSLLRKYQSVDTKFYGALWNACQNAEIPRTSRILAVVLRDRRPVTDKFRYCDSAVWALESKTGQKFGVGDEAVVHALAWLKVQGLSN